MEPTNDSRADLALQALANSDQGGQEDTDVTDLLADLMHFCRREGFDFDYCLQSARMHFEEEVEEEQP